MKKFLSILIAISLVQVGISYAADPATDLENRDYIFGTSKNSDVNLNQVLFLLAGKMAHLVLLVLRVAMVLMESTASME